MLHNNSEWMYDFSCEIYKSGGHLLAFLHTTMAFLNLQFVLQGFFKDFLRSHIYSVQVFQNYFATFFKILAKKYRWVLEKKKRKDNANESMHLNVEIKCIFFFYRRRTMSRSRRHYYVFNFLFINFFFPTSYQSLFYDSKCQ